MFSGRLGLLFLACGLAVVGVAWAGLKGESAPPLAQPEPSLASPPIALLQPAPETTLPAGEPTAEATEPALNLGSPLLFFALRTEGSSHIRVQPAGVTAQYPLTSGEWDDRDPVVSPDGSRLAFASSRGGGWDLYLMELATGDVRRLTETKGYEGRPTWSPDGLWLAYEAYYGDDLDIWILPADGGQPAIQLTDDPASDLAPTWDPSGRRIAFISDRSGFPDLFLADLDKPVDRFINLSQTPYVAESDPAFDPTGVRIAYSTWTDGLEQIWLLDASELAPVEWVGQGGRPSWYPDGSMLTAILTAPTRAQVVTYGLSPNGAPLGVSVAGQLDGLNWTATAKLPSWAAPADTAAGAETEEGSQPASRPGLVTLPGVVPDGLVLSQAVFEPFMGLRQRAGSALGWDFLGQLDLAFVDLNDPLPPGFSYSDWLHTGRAFALTQAAYQAGWVEIVRQDFGSQIYWQVFVRTAVRMAVSASHCEPGPGTSTGATRATQRCTIRAAARRRRSHPATTSTSPHWPPGMDSNAFRRSTIGGPTIPQPGSVNSPSPAGWTCFRRCWSSTRRRPSPPPPPSRLPPKPPPTHPGRPPRPGGGAGVPRPRSPP